MKKLMCGAFAAALCLLALAASAATVQEREPNDERNQAMVIQPGDTVEGTSSAARALASRRADDTDWYRIINLVSPGRYTITVTPAIANCQYLFGSSLTTAWWGYGQGTLVLELTGQKRTNIIQRWSDKPERRSATGEEPTQVYVFVENQPNEGGGGASQFRCVKGGPWFAEVSYRLTVTAGAGPQPPLPPPNIGGGNKEIEQPPIKPGDRVKSLADITKDIVINPGATWEGDLRASRTLDLLARLQYANVAGANRCLDISVNRQRLAGPLLNKASQFTIGDGRSFPYFDGSAWALFYSPDFSANNTPGAGRYQVVTNPGEAYRYRWDISALIGSAATMHVRIVNTNKANSAPIVLRFTP